ncbi:hypothetical protein [Wenjunlia vitaminophila]|nr:hypothetical protein [Wenjunlia vitaminophila]
MFKNSRALLRALLGVLLPATGRHRLPVRPRGAHRLVREAAL